jgi:hypothetical protein
LILRSFNVAFSIQLLLRIKWGKGGAVNDEFRKIKIAVMVYPGILSGQTEENHKIPSSR